MNKIALNKMLRALNIAKILFEYEGYHTRYLEQTELIIKKVHSYGFPVDKEINACFKNAERKSVKDGKIKTNVQGK